MKYQGSFRAKAWHLHQWKKNVLFSQVKTSPLLWPLWLLCYESPLSQQKIIFKWYNIFLNIFQKHFEKYFTRSLGSIVKFRISARPCNTLHFLICNNSIASSNKLSIEIEKMFFFLISLLIDHFDYFHEPEYLNKLWGCHFFSIFKLWCITSATHHSHIHFPFLILICRMLFFEKENPLPVGLLSYVL